MYTTKKLLRLLRKAEVGGAYFFICNVEKLGFIFSQLGKNYFLTGGILFPNWGKIVFILLLWCLLIEVKCNKRVQYIRNPNCNHWRYVTVYRKCRGNGLEEDVREAKGKSYT